MLTASRFSTKFSELAVGLVFPRRCCLCARMGDYDICQDCRAEFPEAPAWERPESPIDYALALFAYDGRASQAVRRLKYNRSTGIAHALAPEIVTAATKAGLMSHTTFVPVPIHWSRRNSRGFNQSELLCRSLPKFKVRPDLLERVRKTRPQPGLSLSEREQNMAQAFRAHGDVKGRNIVLVDDVFTSGITAVECAKTLKAAGALAVGILALCRGGASSDGSWQRP